MVDLQLEKSIYEHPARHDLVSSMNARGGVISYLELVDNVDGVENVYYYLSQGGGLSFRSFVDELLAMDSSLIKFDDDGAGHGKNNHRFHKGLMLNYADPSILNIHLAKYLEKSQQNKVGFDLQQGRYEFYFISEKLQGFDLPAIYPMSFTDATTSESKWLFFEQKSDFDFTFNMLKCGFASRFDISQLINVHRTSLDLIVPRRKNQFANAGIPDPISSDSNGIYAYNPIESISRRSIFDLTKANLEHMNLESIMITVNRELSLAGSRSRSVRILQMTTDFQLGCTVGLSNKPMPQGYFPIYLQTNLLHLLTRTETGWNYIPVVFGETTSRILLEPSNFVACGNGSFILQSNKLYNGDKCTNAANELQTKLNALPNIELKVKKIKKGQRHIEFKINQS